MSTNTEKSGTDLIVRVLIADEFKAKVSNALPANVTPERFMSAAVTAVRTFKEAGEVTRDSLYNSVIQAAQAGLLPDGKQGALVSFNVKVGENRYEKVARFMPMVEGLLHQLGNAGIHAYAVSVHQNDVIELWNDEAGQHVTHRPKTFGDRGPRVGALAVAKTRDGSTYVETMDMEDLKKVMAASRSKDRNGNPVGPWKDWTDRMEQKSVLHRLAKRLPKPDNFQMTDDPDDDPVDPPEDAPPPRRPRALQTVIDQVPEVVPEREPGSDDVPPDEGDRDERLF